MTPGLVIAVALAFGSAPRPSREHRFDPEITAAITTVRGIFPVPPALVRAVIRRESDFNPQARSPVGARGLMQVMPANARRLGCNRDDLWRPGPNILAGVRLLAVLLEHYRGDLVSALVAYNARPRRLGSPLPPNAETPRYVWAVLGFYEQYRREEERAPAFQHTRAQESK